MIDEEGNQRAQTAGEAIELSNYTSALLEALHSIPKRKIHTDQSPIVVSRTVSFFAIVYEKIRNAVEFREEHLVRRAAIERILARRLSLNPEGKGEAENLLRELLWARYLPVDSISVADMDRCQAIIDKYLYLKRKVIMGRDTKTRERLAEHIKDYMSCELEEQLNLEDTARKSAYLHFFFQVLKNKVEVKDVQKDTGESYFYVASEYAFAKNDLSYIRYHLFQLFYEPLHTMPQAKIDEIGKKFVELTLKIDQIIKNPYIEKLVRFAKKQVPPFRILFTITDRYPKEVNKLLVDTNELWNKVESLCREKYQATGNKVRTAAVRSIIYIFLTKAIFALILEYPLSLYLYGEVHYIPLVINTIFPPMFMGLLVSFVHIPDERNTKKIYERIIDILNRDPSFETTKKVVAQKSRVKRPLLLLGFTIFYLLTFGITFLLIYWVLDLLHFNIIGKTVFIIFISMVAFFGYRIQQTTKEYTLDEKQGILSPFIDFFFVPILFVGKFLSSEVAKLNVFILFFDFLIEAPFKLISEIVEEWITFVRQRKEEIM